MQILLRKSTMSDEHPAIQRAVAKFGTTTDPTKAAFITPGGSMIAHGRTRTHDEVASHAMGLKHSNEEDHDAITPFQQATGSLRYIHARSKGGDGETIIQAEHPITPQQKSVVSGNHRRGDFFMLSAYANHRGKSADIHEAQKDLALHSHVGGAIDKTNEKYAKHFAKYGDGGATGGDMGKALVVLRLTKNPRNLSKAEDVTSAFRAHVHAYADKHGLNRQWLHRGANAAATANSDDMRAHRAALSAMDGIPTHLGRGTYATHAAAVVKSWRSRHRDMGKSAETGAETRRETHVRKVKAAAADSLRQIRRYPGIGDNDLERHMADRGHLPRHVNHATLALNRIGKIHSRYDHGEFRHYPAETASPVEA